MDTKLSLYEIELRIARSRDFDYTKKLVVFNVIGQGSVLPLWHECDVLVCTKIGYLTEIEIKRSYADFLNDFKKEHTHKSRYIKQFYYCVPIKIKDKVREFLETYENQDDWRAKAGIITYYDDSKWIDIVKAPSQNKDALKLTLEQMYYLARLGSMRVLTLKRKIISMHNQIGVLSNAIADMENDIGELMIVDDKEKAEI